jgi:predicted Zn-dependent peptidase
LSSIYAERHLATPAALERDILITALPNGINVITESMSHVRSVSVGVWISSGSRRETTEQNGISHFIEHMLFKGTTHRSAEDIARSVDSIGGNLDAFTAKEMVCFNTKVLDEHLPIALDVLSDLVLNPLFREDDIEKEKGVILEEIKMDADSPDYLVHEIFTSNFWKDHPLGKPILGTKETVNGFTEAAVRDYYRGLRICRMWFLSLWIPGLQPMPALRCGRRRNWNRCTCAWACLLIRFRMRTVSFATC